MELELSRRITEREWREERRRFEVLLAVYARSQTDCTHQVTGAELCEALDLRPEDVFRVIHSLEYHGYLDYVCAGPRVCLTPKGRRYIELEAGQRRSLRIRPSISAAR